MSVLCDRSIHGEVESGRLAIEPFDPSMLQPASLDVRADGILRLFRNSRVRYIDVREPSYELTERVELAGEEPFILHPGEFVLGQTVERIALPGDLVCGLNGKSSLGRLGLQVHATAGWCDPGFGGAVTLELSNVANLPITLYRGMPIAQLSFLRLDRAAERPYGSEGLGSKYHGQTEPTPSRFHLDFAERSR